MIQNPFAEAGMFGSHWAGPAQRILDAGGPVVGILLAMSVVMIAIAVYKLLEYQWAGVLFSRAFRRSEVLVDHALAQPNGFDDSVRAAAVRFSSGRITESILRLSAEGRLSDAAMQQEMSRLVQREDSRLRSGLGVLELIGSLAPLLGLLGTVLGMIDAFQAMQAAGANVDPATLSGGIWTALLTTAVGLSVAIPAIVLHHWLASLADRHVGGVSDLLVRVATRRAHFARATSDSKPRTAGHPRAVV